MTLDELVRVEYHGSTVLLRPLRSEVLSWLREHTESGAQWFYDAVAVEPRYVAPIMAGIREDFGV
jgi:hypothetical protein